MEARFREGLEMIVGVGRNISKFIKNNTKIEILLAGAAINGFSDNCFGYEYTKGRLEIYNDVSDYNFITGFHKTGHTSGQEGFDTKDSGYGVPWEISPETKATKIVSIISEWPYELNGDARPIDSFTPINLELSLHEKDGNQINASSLQNWLRCVIDPMYIHYDFGSKPITYWERDVNDPNMFYLIANVRKEIAQNGGVIPLADLNGTYGSEEPYLHAQIRFNDHFVHLNDDGIVDLKDYAIFADNLGRTGITNTNREDPDDLGAWADYDLDGDVDMADLGIFSDYYLTSKTYHLEDGWILE